MSFPIKYNFADLKQYASVASKTGTRPINEPVGDGSRNSSLTTAAGFYRRRGWTEVKILSELQRINATYHPPLPDSEVQSVAKSVMRYLAEFATTDLGNRERVIAAHGDEIRYNITLGRNLYWNKRFWQLDEGGIVWDAKITSTVLSIHDEAKAAAAAGNDNRHTALLKWAAQSQGKQRRDSIAADLRKATEIAFPCDRFDANSWLLNCRNGTVNLKDGDEFGLHPFDRNDLLTAGSDIEYKENASCTLWLEFLNRIFAGNKNIIRWVQKFCGYCMTGQIGEQIFTIFYGDGSNGKSTLLSVLQYILGVGRYCCKVDPDLLIAYKDKVASCEVAALVAMRLAIASETKKNGVLRVDRIKEWTGDDVVHARALYQAPFDFKRQFKLLLLTNYKPRLTETGEAVRRRIRLVPFTVQIPEVDQKKDYHETLIAAEASGILAWMVEGCRLWQKEGLSPPEEIAAASAEYIDSQDQIQQFVDARCESDASYATPAGELYRAYNYWCRSTGCLPQADKNFKTGLLALKSATITETRKNFGMVYHGIRLREDSVEGSADNMWDNSRVAAEA